MSTLTPLENQSLSSNAFEQEKRNAALDDNMVPMINIVFLLIIFFMIAGQIKTIDTGELSLPNSTQETPATPATFTIRLDANKQLTVNQESVSIDVLASVLADSASPRSELTESTINLIFDTSLTAADIETVLQPLRGVGIKKINLLTEKKTAQ